MPCNSSSSTFRDFWMGGFEGADHLNSHGLPLDMASACGHVDQLDADHAQAAALGIGCVRESIGWRLAEPEPGRLDLSRVVAIALSAQRHGLQVVWTLMHYGTPADVSLLDDGMQPRFVRFAEAVAKQVGQLSDEPPVYNLINEIGFLAWTVSETNRIFPYRGDPECRGDTSAAAGYDVKRRLVEATIAATDAVRRIDPRARFLQVEPLVHVVAPRDRPELAAFAEQIAGYQWQVWDLLAAVPGALDVIGVNHYHSGQWEAGTEARLEWHLRDPRRRAFSDLLERAWQRYRRPMIVAETSHFGDGRADWLHEICAEVRRARERDVPVHGICLYPLVDRPDWDKPEGWHHAGLWDVAVPGLERVPCPDYAAALRTWQVCLPWREHEHEREHDPTQEHLPDGRTMHCLIVFSHLRWNFVYQRPQHLMSRLSERYRVVFIEEPMRGDGPPRLDRIARGPNLEVLVPYTDVDAFGFDEAQMPALRELLRGWFAEQGIERPLVWFYTPLALPLLTLLQPRGVIYDCMDELSAFRNAPPLLKQRESELLAQADIVLTGGPALYDAKKHRHPKVVCLPSSVDSAHFQPSGLAFESSHAVDARAAQGDFDGPRLGFFGVIDERFDIELLARLADAHPAWQLVMVGPVVKIDPALLPQRPNILWLGSQPYTLLPYLLHAWDVALMPFAINESTRFISPTKTLEYMAAAKPIVSTAVTDVVGLYGHCVSIASDADEFVRHCEAALAESPQAQAMRMRDMREAVAKSSWDLGARQVGALLDELAAGADEPAAPVRPVADVLRLVTKAERALVSQQVAGEASREAAPRTGQVAAGGAPKGFA